MPKNIVICCDGTGNEFRDRKSNVVKLYSTLAINQDQVAYYHPGVGTMGAPTARNWWERQWTRAKGLAFGAGLLDNVADAYRYLMNHYADGDRIFLFGFSRGAYTVRVLGGVLRKYGLLCPGNEDHIPYIMRMYAKKRREAGRQTRIVENDRQDDEFKWTFSRQEQVDLHFVGVWDTVSSIGWIYDPIKLPFTGTNSIIRNGRQAIAVDERRCFYMPLLWAQTPSDSEQDIKQVWFRGAHSDVGGSYPEEESQLSQVTLEWMLQEAVGKGLKVNAYKALCVLGKQPKCEPFLPDFLPGNPAAAIHKSLKGAWWLLEALPHRYDTTEDAGHQTRCRIPLGAHRRIPAGSRIYDPVVKHIPSKYLPREYTREPLVNFQPRVKTELLLLAKV
jgi:uncharacterized protein (DUF2235 family)